MKKEFFYNSGNVKTELQYKNGVLHFHTLIKFNDNIIGLMLDDEYFTNKEERYTLFDQKEENNNFC